VAILQAPITDQPTIHPTTTRIIAHVGIGDIPSPPPPPKCNGPPPPPPPAPEARPAGCNRSSATPTRRRCPLMKKGMWRDADLLTQTIDLVYCC
jgi:hypothetical protein